jgi:hypothetical protein
MDVTSKPPYAYCLVCGDWLHLDPFGIYVSDWDDDDVCYDENTILQGMHTAGTYDEWLDAGHY